MRLKSVCALVALAMGLAAVCPAAMADTVSLNPGYHREGYGDDQYTVPNSSFDDLTNTVTVTGGGFDGGAYAGYTYDLVLAPASPLSYQTTPDEWGGGEFDAFGSVTGTYTIYKDGSSVSSGTVSADGHWSGSYFMFEILNDAGDEVVDSFPMYNTGRIIFSAGAFRPTDGTSILGFATGPVAFDGDLGFDGPAFFWGNLSDAPVTAVPLPASATMGLGLVGLLGAAQFARRRFRTA